ncbi:amidohydrolase family protein [Hyphomonas neptunium ATCC 15444]|uniref:Amidohydrolase family protein n=2 Tax=Hyphomonas TaxID=85 RepID=Q0C559_HYPNA|nr:MULTISPECIES: amidohydrolase family protein [Hyphomonas]ABI77667.1 amidohydrolase family protein [Hyphomonas neptunium ATCC 15444]KCZ95567.1 amidohydrolase family protein [Hyphomonas hirschiana VP5]
MRFSTIGKWSLRAGGVITVLILLAVAVLFILINRDVDRVYGGQTGVAGHAPFQAEAKPTAITHVSVLSPDGTEMLANRTVLLENGEIVSVAPDGEVPDGMFVIDGEGKFLIPGLIDSHVHLQRSPNDLLLYVANGVTQIRSMGGSDADLALKREIENGRIGPRFYVSSTAMASATGLTSAGPDWFSGPVAIWFAELAFNMHSTSSSEQAAEDARSFIQKGYDGIKLYGFLDMDSYRAILDVADELDVPSAGHLPDAMPLSELRTTKLREIAHIEEIVKGLLLEFGSFRSQGGEAFIEFVESRKAEIISDLVANDVAVHSTLWLTESFKKQVFDLEAALAEVPLEYANPGIVEGNSVLGLGWLPARNKFHTYAGNTPEEIARNKAFWDAREEAHHILLKAMVEGGVTVLAGTDANAWLTIPGFSLHDELQSLSRAGMSPAQAIYAATAAPAQIIRNNAGIIETGRRADLVLLNENPLTDIENTTSIDTVILNGRILDRAQLDAMLEAVRETNAESRKFDLELYQ